MSAFRRALREQARARVAIDGPAKAGKSFTALRLAFALGDKVAAIDTEFGSLSKYAGDGPDGEGPFNFDVVELKKFSPGEYVSAIRDAEAGGYEVLVIDSLSHAWVGEGGILDQADKSKSKNNYTKWADLTPQQRKLVDAILASPLHVVATMRSKMEYELVDEVNAAGKKVKVPVKVGLAPIQREGMEYEFDLLCSVDVDHLLKVSGSRCPNLDGASALKPGAKFFKPYVDWLRTGATPAPRPAPEAAAPPSAKPSVNGTTRGADNGQAPPADTPEITELKRLKAELQIGTDDWAAILARRGVESARQLSAGQQADLIGVLRLKLEESKQTLQEALADEAAGDKSVGGLGY